MGKQVTKLLGGRACRKILPLIALAGFGLAACTGSSTGGTGPTPGASGSVAAPSGTATAYPVPASASPSTLPAVATRSNAEWTYTLNTVRRIAPGELSVEGTLVSKASGTLTGLEEPGYAVRKGTDGKLDSTYEVSAISVTVPGDSTVYLPMRDDTGRCACTQGLVTIKVRQPYAVYTVVSAPAAATSVTVTVRGLAPFTNVPVAS